jgi:rod shape-determining protein MreC
MALASLGRDPPPFFRQGPSALSRLALFSALALLLMVADARFQMMQPLRATIATAMYPLQWLALQPLQLSQTLNARANAWMANDNAVRVLGEQLIS